MVAAEVASCIDAGACKVLTLTSYYVAIGVFITSGVLLVILFLLAFWTPGFIFLKAKISKNPLIYIVNRGQSGRFTVGRAKSEGILDVSKVGPFLVTENSHTRENKSGLPLFFGFGEFAGTLPLKWVYATNKIKDVSKGEIKNIEDFGKKIGKNYNEAKGTWD